MRKIEQYPSPATADSAVMRTLSSLEVGVGLILDESVPQGNGLHEGYIAAPYTPGDNLTVYLLGLFGL